MALFAGLRAGQGRLPGGGGRGRARGPVQLPANVSAPKSKRVAPRSAAGNRKIWRPDLSGMANKPLKTYGGSY